MRIISILIFFLSTTGCFAFNWNECRNSMKATGANVFTASTAVLGSMSSYLSSTGKCSMLGLVEHDQKLFIAQAYEPLQVDIAKGSGEFADAFAEISKCNNLGKIEMKRKLQNKFEMIFNNTEIDIEKTHSRIIGIMKSDLVIAKNCKLES